MKRLIFFVFLAGMVTGAMLYITGATSSNKQAKNNPHAVSCCNYLTNKYIRNDLEPPQPPGAQNTTGCLWDADDGWRDDPVFPAHADVYLASGTSAIDTMCVVASDSEVFVNVDFYSNLSNLELTVCFPGIDNRCLDFSLPHQIQLDRHTIGYEYYGCFGIFYETGDPAMQVIPGTNGGYGRQSQMIMTLSNPTAIKALLFEKDLAFHYRSTFGGQGIVNFSQTYPIAYHCQTETMDDRPFYWYP